MPISFETIHTNVKIMTKKTKEELDLISDCQEDLFYWFVRGEEKALEELVKNDKVLLEHGIDWIRERYSVENLYTILKNSKI